MPSDDILDLIGRHATGSLSAEEQQRLFAAALVDQDLFDQLVHEQDVKQMLNEPGVRDRMIRALEPPPRRRTAWIFSIAATAGLTVVLMVFLLRPAPKPPQVALEKSPAAPAVVTSTEAPPAEPPSRDATPPELKKAEPQPVRREAKAKKQDLPAGQPSPDSPVKDAEKKETDQVQVAAAAPPPVAAPQSAAAPQKTSEALQVQPLRAQQAAPQQQNSPGGPRQATQQSRFASPSAIGGFYDAKGELPFGFHYSLEIEGHLSIIPAADGYLYVKSNDGSISFGPKLSAAGIIVDLPVTDAVGSIVITFSRLSAPVQIKPATRTEPTGNVEGKTPISVEIKVK